VSVPIQTRWMADLRAAPAVALWPGLAGLIPFIAGTLALWLAPAGLGQWLWKAFIAYGAVILTFVGAIHWGIALALPHGANSDRANPAIAFGYGWSVVPALVGWLALLVTLLAMPVVGVLLLVTGFATQLFIDARITAAHRLPAWYLALRLLLTAVVVASLLLALPA
jgi:hypothetical protein